MLCLAALCRLCPNFSRASMSYLYRPEFPGASFFNNKI
jgi:hypothetical protein